MWLRGGGVWGVGCGFGGGFGCAFGHLERQVRVSIVVDVPAPAAACGVLGIDKEILGHLWERWDKGPNEKKKPLQCTGHLPSVVTTILLRESSKNCEGGSSLVVFYSPLILRSTYVCVAHPSNVVAAEANAACKPGGPPLLILRRGRATLVPRVDLPLRDELAAVISDRLPRWDRHRGEGAATLAGRVSDAHPARHATCACRPGRRAESARSPEQPQHEQKAMRRHQKGVYQTFSKESKTCLVSRQLDAPTRNRHRGCRVQGRDERTCSIIAAGRVSDRKVGRAAAAGAAGSTCS